ncbi:tRNA (adenosine(37)-N6)-threonylcarbamoyltransferase complex ATPase subunit type 1 TsaE [Phorcysia thermohydrogeniphila]|uniref:tRNA (adenosine(37)-N6)-threonylcarbamoyltransferase complex ATPase subunit type 1 TsaE n=1 Tax=Phorcysia thermohydrogeniphila TaxID=936138 RepID=UPI00104CFFBF|nr:tRNA (adenosine(37)-N6)-threonylcarbamoyltransferase complex ATPase subunit type 1 TsaE [Phorcysia thermohydrogeniphila]
MNRCSVRTKSVEETRELGKALGELLPPKVVVILSGELGCGKTELTRGIAEALGIPADDVSSPSFNLVHEYDELIHVDLYRLDSIEAAEDIGIEELLLDNRPKIIEWGETIEELLECLPVIKIRCRQAGEEREFEISDSTGKICRELLKKLS